MSTDLRQRLHMVGAANRELAEENARLDSAYRKVVAERDALRSCLNRHGIAMVVGIDCVHESAPLKTADLVTPAPQQSRNSVVIDQTPPRRVVDPKPKAVRARNLAPGVRRCLSLIRKQPGIGYMALQDQAGLSYGTVVIYVGELRKAGLITVQGRPATCVALGNAA